MLSEDVLLEYGVQTNEMYTCSDSGKRDRYSWLGDRLVSSRTVMTGAGQGQFVWGPAEEAFSRQIPSGQIPINTLFSPLDPEGALIRTSNVDPLLVDYNFDFMQVIYNYWLRYVEARGPYAKFKTDLLTLLLKFWKRYISPTTLGPDDRRHCLRSSAIIRPKDAVVRGT
jgi:hypothetical protein